jgi:hypothetical protein
MIELSFKKFFQSKNEVKVSRRIQETKDLELWRGSNTR